MGESVELALWLIQEGPVITRGSQRRLGGAGQKSAPLAESILHAAIVTADGQPVVWASRILGMRCPNALPVLT